MPRRADRARPAPPPSLVAGPRTPPPPSATLDVDSDFNLVLDPSVVLTSRGDGAAGPATSDLDSDLDCLFVPSSTLLAGLEPPRPPPPPPPWLLNVFDGLDTKGDGTAVDSDFNFVFDGLGTLSPSVVLASMGEGIPDVDFAFDCLGNPSPPVGLASKGDDAAMAAWDHDGLCHLRAQTLSTASVESTGATLSPVQTSPLDWSRGASPLATEDKSLAAVAAAADDDHDRDHRDAARAHSQQCASEYRPRVQAATHANACHWAGCSHPSFPSRDALAWHVKAEHLLVCPVAAYAEPSLPNARMLRSHVAIAHPDVAIKDGIGEWRLSLPPSSAEVMRRSVSAQSGNSAADEVLAPVTVSKKKYQDRLRRVVEAKVRKSAGKPRVADSSTGLVPPRASKLIDMASFALVFEHAVLPFLAEVLPSWTGPRHVVSVTCGRAPLTRRICIMTRVHISRARRVIIAGHVGDLLPEKYRWGVSFVFSLGEVSRANRWARGLGKELADLVCAPRNPYHFCRPCMGDSIGIEGSGFVEDSTATLGPCLEVSGGRYWLANFHPFLEACQSFPSVDVEHPSPQDRAWCLGEGHDAMAEDAICKIGHVEFTSGPNLKTTRISHDPYWDDCAKDYPPVVTDWALIAAADASACDANTLRRLPSSTQPLLKEPFVRSTGGGVVPGATVVSSGRTSGHQRGRVCEVPAYVSGDENGTGKATREWFVEEPPPPWDDEEMWIRGGIGVEGDSGAAIVDVETSCLVGQLWGRNKYWGPGPRLTFFTPIADVFDDIQETCRLRAQPRLPQRRDDADRYPVYPSCRQCYDLRTYLDSRRTSRASLQSMIMYPDDPDQTSIDAASELATPRDCPHDTGVKEARASFHGTPSPIDARLGLSMPTLPMIASEIRSPYPQLLELDDALDLRSGFVDNMNLRTYLDGRRSSRASLQGMSIFTDDIDQDQDQDQTSVEAASELATLQDCSRDTGAKEVEASSHSVSSPINARLGLSVPTLPVIASEAGGIRSPNTQSSELDAALDPQSGLGDNSNPAKRSLPCLDTSLAGQPVSESRSKRTKRDC